MKTLRVVIEPGKDGFGVMYQNPELSSVTSFGETLNEAKENAREALIDFMEFYNESNHELPGILKSVDIKNINLKFTYMLKYYFKEFPYLNISQLAYAINENPSLLRQYDKGLVFASEDKYFKIRDGIRAIGKELEAAT